MTLVNMRFEGRGLLPDVVTWTPERDLPFFRITEAPLSMPWLAPDGKTMLTVDIGCEVGDSIWTMADERSPALCLEGLETSRPRASATLSGMWGVAHSHRAPRVPAGIRGGPT